MSGGNEEEAGVDDVLPLTPRSFHHQLFILQADEDSSNMVFGRQ